MRTRTSKISVGIFLLVLFSQSFYISNAKTVEYPEIYSRTTNIEWESVVDSQLNENYSYFEFTIDYEIYNPNDISIEITFPHCNLFFEGNMSINFEDQDLEAYQYEPIGLCSDTEMIIKSGISNGTALYTLIIQEPSITVLPDGEYNICIYGYSLTNVIMSITSMIIDEGTIDIDYEDFLTDAVNISFYLLLISLIFLSIPLLRKRK